MRLRDQSAYEVKREDSAQLRGGKKRSEGLKKGKGNKEANDVFGDGRRGRQSVRGRKTGSLVKYTGRLRGPHGWLGAGGEQCWAAAGQLAGAKPSPGPDQVLWEPSKLGEATRYMPVGPRGRPPPCAMHCFLFGAGWKHASWSRRRAAMERRLTLDSTRPAHGWDAVVVWPAVHDLSRGQPSGWVFAPWPGCTSGVRR
jgi:hypothetical protein